MQRYNKTNNECKISYTCIITGAIEKKKERKERKKQKEATLKKFIEHVCIIKSY